MVLAKAGYDVAITYNSQKEEAQSLAAEMKPWGENALLPGQPGKGAYRRGCYS